MSHSFSQCDFYDNISVSSSGFNSTAGYSQRYVLVANSAGSPGNIISINTTGNFTDVAEGSYFVYAINFSGSTPGTLIVGGSWNTFISSTTLLCIEILAPYLGRSVYVCNLNSLCAPNLIQATTNGYNSSYNQIYTLCNSSTDNILAYNTFGIFDESDYNNQAGIYTVYALNTNDVTVINAIQVGVNINTIQNLQNTECIEVSTPKAFNIEACNPLPIGLIDFQATLVKDQVELKWSSSTELNNDYYTIEKTADFENWEEVSKVNGAGNSSTVLNYKTFDLDPWNGTTYYRLKQTDYNGAFSYHGIETIIFDVVDHLTAFPNPSNGIIQLRASKKIRQIKVFSVINQLVESIENTNTIDLEHLSSAPYVLEVHFEDGSIELLKIILSK